jgi:hypothetical protein
MVHNPTSRGFGHQQRRAGSVPGDPIASAAPIMGVVDADSPPLRVFFGTAPLGIAENDYEGRLATCRVAAGG